MKLINKKAKFNYDIEDTIEAGIVLTGEEVKAIRRNSVDFTGSHVTILGMETYVLNLHIGIQDINNSRKTRKLLLNKKEIINLASRKESDNLTLIPISIYNKGPRIKIEVGLVRGKKKSGKKQSLKEQDIKRNMERELKEYLKE